jgi:acid phosphatase
VALLSLTLVSGCVSQDDNSNAVLWVQTSAEYDGNTHSVYQSASQQLAQLLNDPGRTGDIDQALSFGCKAGEYCAPLMNAGLIPAVVLDVNETVLDNSPYQARLVADRQRFDPATWDLWLAERAAKAVPGSVEFVKEAQRLGVAVIYITNRSCKKRDDTRDPCPQKADTLANMRAVGFPGLAEHDLMIFQREKPAWQSSEKQLRRAFIAGKYRMMQLIGDDIGDLASNVKNLPQTDRRTFVDEQRHLFGVYWFQLANPTYGSWIRALGETPADSLDTGR